MVQNGETEGARVDTDRLLIYECIRLRTMQPSTKFSPPQLLRTAMGVEVPSVLGLFERVMCRAAG